MAPGCAAVPSTTAPRPVAGLDHVEKWFLPPAAMIETQAARWKTPWLEMEIWRRKKKTVLVKMERRRGGDWRAGKGQRAGKGRLSSGLYAHPATSMEA